MEKRNTRKIKRKIQKKGKNRQSLKHKGGYDSGLYQYRSLVVDAFSIYFKASSEASKPKTPISNNKKKQLKDEIIKILVNTEYKIYINTLIPINVKFVPVEKVSSVFKVPPSIVNFVPLISIVIHHLEEKFVLPVLSTFLENSGNINLKSSKGKEYKITALSEAIVSNPQLVPILLEKGADLGLLSDEHLQKMLVMGPKINAFVQRYLDLRRNQEQREEQREEQRKEQREEQRKEQREEQRKEEQVRVMTSPKEEKEKEQEKEKEDLDNDLRELKSKMLQELLMQSSSRTQKQTILMPSPVLETPPKLSKKLDLNMKMGLSEPYDINTMPEFWKPIFENDELMGLRDKFKGMIQDDLHIGMNIRAIEHKWELCKTVETMIPSFITPTVIIPKEEHGTMVAENTEDFKRKNILLCSGLIFYGYLAKKMLGQDYKLLFKGGKAVQLVLEPIFGKYDSEDIDVFLVHTEAFKYNLEESKNLAMHIGRLMEWFFNGAFHDSSIASVISLLPPEKNTRNQNIVKLSYTKTDGRYVAISDIDFKQVLDSVQSYLSGMHTFPFHVLDIDILFMCPQMEYLLWEKIYYYSIYKMDEYFLKRGKKVIKKEQGELDLNTCNFYLNKFSKSLRALFISRTITQIQEKGGNIDKIGIIKFIEEMNEVMNENIDDILLSIKGFPVKKVAYIHLKEDVMHSLFPGKNLFHKEEL